MIPILAKSRQALWQPSEKVKLIDLREDFYRIKLIKTENYEKNTPPRSMVPGNPIHIHPQVRAKI